MHELGILYQTLHQIDQIAKEEGCTKITEIYLEVGELSGVLPSYLKRYFPQSIQNNPLFKDCKLHISTIVCEAVCNECETVYNVKENHGICPCCASRNRKILSGRDFVISQIIAYGNNVVST